MKFVAPQQMNPEGQQQQPQTILVKIKVIKEGPPIELKYNVPPTGKFTGLANTVHKQVFSQHIQAQYLESIIYILPDTSEVRAGEQRTLSQLGIQDGDLVTVRLQLKGGCE